MWAKRSDPSSSSNSSSSQFSSLFSSLVGKDNLDRTKAALSDAASKVQSGAISGVFKSAMDYIGQSATGPGAGGLDHPLVGTSVEVGGKKFKIRSLLAEGGFALVFSCQDSEGRWYALKRLMACDADAAEAIIQEINFLKELSGHPCILKFVGAGQIKQNGRVEYLLLTEYCPGGALNDLIQKDALTAKQVVQIFYAVCSAVNCMHDRSPPITHRDLKIENLLFDAKGHVKLCDFGSATTSVYRPDDSWSVLKRTQLEEDMQKFTTPMYRAPEILDTYQNFPIGPSQDLWALGCILAYICYRKHPFEDSAKLRIINAKYSLPQEETPYSIFHPVIESLLQPDPYNRPTIGDVLERLEAIAVVLEVDQTAAPVEGVLPDTPVDQPSRPPPPRPAAPPKAKKSVPEDPFLSNPFGQKPSPVKEKPQRPQKPPADDFFSSLGWSAAQQESTSLFSEEQRAAAIQQEQNAIGSFGAETNPPVPKHHEQPERPPVPPNRTESRKEQKLTDVDYERMYGIRVSEEAQFVDEEADKYKFDYEKKEQPKVEEKPTRKLENDPFDLFDAIPRPSQPQNHHSAADLLGDWPSENPSQMRSNSSVPNLEKKAFDPFAEFLAANGGPPDLKPSEPPKSLNNSGRSTPAQSQQKGFGSFFQPAQGMGPKFGENAFDDILSQQGFASSKVNSQRTLADLKREEEVQNMDPNQIKIRDWTKGKERNIRALLGSLNDVLWEGQHNWNQPGMGELLTDVNVSW
uniref:Protein kinase domain-containing protein n=1 Tax=Bursaphelenchus xylophilus TaxID=6326 RepID=A0A1I7SA26_BURXY